MNSAQTDAIVIGMGFVTVYFLGFVQGLYHAASRKISVKVASQVLADESKRVRELLNGRKKMQVLGI